ncbi:MAG: glucosidase [Myxococcota bacterium]
MKGKTAEHRRLNAHRDRVANWRLWGPYLSERAWGTVREDYSPGGHAWRYFPHEHARSRAYRWNEDGLCGISDRSQYLCLSPAFWNGRDRILKERLFGLTGEQGNHGEDAKEYWYYLDNTPTHSWMRALYKYPHAPYPYERLVSENRHRGRLDPECDLVDLGVFEENRYFDIELVYAKGGERDLLVEITAHNRGPEAADLTALVQLWFRNTWDWGHPDGPMGDVPEKPSLTATEHGIRAEHAAAGTYWLYAEAADTVLFTENSSNVELLFGADNPQPYVKDAFHRALVDGDATAVNPAGVGTKCAAVWKVTIEAGGSARFRARLCDEPDSDPFGTFAGVLKQRKKEADNFYATVQPQGLDADAKRVQRQALAGMLWTKQLYYYDVSQWLSGDPVFPAHPARREGRNRHWGHLVNFDVISMPDKWEYPWYATWDLAFHCIPLALVDADFAKRQIELFTREWFMHPNGQLPAYEWALDDVNPPVHAYAAWRVYKMEEKQTGRRDQEFLAGVFHKLLLNFTWWVNRKDAEGSNIFQGGFLGLDNIGLFDRSKPLPGGGRIDQSDGTAWMGAYCLHMMKMALELSRDEPVYQDLATKFFEHFLRVAHAMMALGDDQDGLWDEDDGFYYDSLHVPGEHQSHSIRVRSLVGLIPLIAVETLEPEQLADMPVFRRRMAWFVENRPEVARGLRSLTAPGVGQRYLVSLVTKERLVRILSRMLDPDEFLSDHGIRSLSRAHAAEPFVLDISGQRHRIGYEPAESQTGMFGGNSNWRGPIWFPINYLLIEALQRYHHYFGDELKVECPTGSGVQMTLAEVADELSRRLCSLFLEGENGRPAYAGEEPFASDPHWRDHVLFCEYFDGDTGKGLGAQHQTGWTGLVAKLLQQRGGHR